MGNNYLLLIKKNVIISIEWKRNGKEIVGSNQKGTLIVITQLKIFLIP